MALSPAYVPTILDFWFGSADPAAAVAPRVDFWFRGGDALDQQVADKFGDVLVAAGNGEAEAWRSTVGGRLAYIILLDQFSRNIHRNDRRAYANDNRALRAALEGLDLGVDRQLGLHQRAFFYLPLEHSEDPRVQNRSVELYTALHAGASDADREVAGIYLKYALAHKDVIDTFGRYPHRNHVLGRTTTMDEFAYLRKPGAGF